jgi:site-specific DNA-methyltransferase (adenine-specific)
MEERANIKLYNEDCLPAMQKMKDNQFDLAIVDPPYGIKKNSQKKSTGKHGGRKEYKQKKWDNSPPNREYFYQLNRVSKNQIIWGANYYPQFLSGSMGWIFWDKGQDLKQSDGELAYTSFQIALRRKIINRVELLKEGTIHITQKPIKLYKWLLKNYAKEGDTILDTHLGSGSIAIACWDMKFDLTGYEIDKEYFDAAVARLERHKAQGQLF